MNLENVIKEVKSIVKEATDVKNWAIGTLIAVAVYTGYTNSLKTLNSHKIPQSNFSGTINKETGTFRHEKNYFNKDETKQTILEKIAEHMAPYNSPNILCIKNDNKQTKYFDWNHDNKVDVIELTRKGCIPEYYSRKSKNQELNPAMTEFQEQYNSYLTSIREAQKTCFEK